MITLINPPLLVLKRDLFTTGIVYMPLHLAHFAGSLRDDDLRYKVIDAFGLAPNRFLDHGDHYVRGLRTSEVVEQVPIDTSILVLYAGHAMSHGVLMEIARDCKTRIPQSIVMILQNSQAVTSYSLPRLQTEIHRNGVDYISTGDPCEHGLNLIRQLLHPNPDLSGLSGIGHLRNGACVYTPPSPCRSEFSVPRPAWSDFPLTSYWRLRYAHGPVESKRYLPVMTSRGCPGQCTFCVAPETNEGRWQPRNVHDIVEEWEWLGKTYEVTEFHVEDMNPTVSEDHTRSLCAAIKERRMNVRWKLVSGTKLEYIRDPRTISMLADAGCNYISFSPESGSSRILQNMRKSFDMNHALDLLKQMHRSGIYSQACFLLGFPGETDSDRALTLDAALRLARAGIDELAVFIVTPLPGSALFQQTTHRPRYSSDFSFSPTWRDDYPLLNQWRLRIYTRFLIRKLLFRPDETMLQCIRFVSRRFRTKMEMVPYRALHTFWRSWRHDNEQ